MEPKKYVGVLLFMVAILLVLVISPRCSGVLVQGEEPTPIPVPDSPGVPIAHRPLPNPPPEAITNAAATTP
ncbi:hypothetical protein SUGI_0017120 [Cryptomeria japonica]|nr:hypothetical protein SUGI_0017120 [Cryptomeria japonica]